MIARARCVYCGRRIDGGSRTERALACVAHRRCVQLDPSYGDSLVSDLMHDLYRDLCEAAPSREGTGA